MVVAALFGAVVEDGVAEAREGFFVAFVGGEGGEDAGWGGVLAGVVDEGVLD